MLFLASQKFEANYRCNHDDTKIGESFTGSEKDKVDDKIICIFHNDLKAQAMESWYYRTVQNCVVNQVRRSPERIM